MNIIKKPDALTFCGTMKPFVVQATRDVTMTLREDSADTPLLAHTFTPSADHTIEVDVARIVEPLLTFTLREGDAPWKQPNIVKTFRVNFAEAENPSASEHTFTVIRGGIDAPADTMENFLRQNFLTWQPSTKGVTYATPEFLTYFAQEPVAIQCIVYNEGKQAREVTLANIPAGECHTVPVQFAAVAAKVGGELPQYYDVMAVNAAGERLTYKQRYFAERAKSEDEQWILFENSLGGIDTFRAWGNVSLSAQHEHKIAEIGEELEEYRVDTVRKWTLHTGHLGRTERGWLLDFFPSRTKYIYAGDALRRIVVTESNADYSVQQLPSDYTFTFRFREPKPYLNIPRTDIPLGRIDVIAPGDASFPIAPRLVEFPRIPPGGGALFPVQSPYSEKWGTTTAGALADYVASVMSELHADDGEAGHRHANMSVLRALDRLNRYLLLDGEKIFAAFADEAGTISKDSDLWDKFLRKDIADTAQKLITFLEGIAIGDGTHGIGGDGAAVLESVVSKVFAHGLTGRGWRVRTDEHGRSEMEVDKLMVRMKAVFAMLEIRKVSYLGGDFSFSAAGSEIVRTERRANGWRCWLVADDGSTRTMNDWRKGDMALCKTHNIKAGVYENVANRYYFRLVTDTGEGVLEDGRTYHYVDLSDVRGMVEVDIDGKLHRCIGYDMSVENDAPKEGDAIVQRGSQTDPDRQHLFDISLSDGALVFYAGVNDFDTASHAVMRLDPRGSFVMSDRFEVRSYAGGDSRPIVCFRGEWVSGRLYGRYDAVTLGGSQYLCVVGRGETTSSRPDGSPDEWMLYVKKGTDGLVMNIMTDRGNIIRNGQGEVTLYASLIRGNEDVTDTFPKACFSWTRNSGNAEWDGQWNLRHRAAGSIIRVSAEDVFRKAVFECVVEE